MLGCNHPRSEPRRKLKARTGHPYFRLQCIHCGAPMSGHLRYAEVEDFRKNGGTVHDWDEFKHQKYLRRRSEVGVPLKKELNRQRSQAWRDQYNRYLSTSEWQVVRGRILNRDNYTCQVCLSRPAGEVHHLSYDRVGQELDSDLTSVCKECHRELHPNNQFSLGSYPDSSGISSQRP